jgi:bacitracin transport system permease protein
MLMVNMYLHPLSGMAAIVSRNISGVSLNQALNIPAAILCIAVWGAASVIIANLALKARK